MNRLSKAFYSRNRRLLKERTNDAVVVIPANSQVQSSYDQAYPFVQDQNFWYLTGVSYPDWLLVLSPRADFLIAPIRPKHGELFDGAHDQAAITQQSGLEVYDNAKGWLQLKGLLKGASAIGTLAPPPHYIKQLGFFANPARRRFIKKVKRLAPSVAVTNVGPDIAALRVIKTNDELALLEKAVDITVGALESVFERRSTYARERDVVTDLTHIFLKSGAEGHAYEPIVASGSRACTIHHADMDQPVERNKMLLFDVGARVNGYAADISRTIPVGKPEPLAIDLLEGLRRIHLAMIEQYKPGALLSDLQDEAERRIGDLLFGLGITKKNDRESAHAYFPHLLSHFLGLDVHDVGDLTRPLEAGMVLTVEPGIYIREHGIGLRLEDDIVITKDGNKNLSGALAL